MNKLLVAGNDKLGRKLLSQLKENKNFYTVIDASSNPKRLWKLIRRGIISAPLLFKMAWAELLRNDYSIEDIRKIYSNADLLKVINDLKIDQVYLFRAGLIINKVVINSRAEILNVHCASIPDYGGLGSIMQALNDEALDQTATLHRVTTKIDEGEVIATLSYKLDKNLSYAKNEEIAYKAGMQLIIEQLS